MRAAAASDCRGGSGHESESERATGAKDIHIYSEGEPSGERWPQEAVTAGEGEGEREEAERVEARLRLRLS